MTPEWASEYVCRLQSLLSHHDLNRFIEAQYEQSKMFESTAIFFRRWIVTYAVLNFVHGRVVVMYKPKRIAVTSACFVGMCFAMGEFDPFALACFVVFNAVTIAFSDL